MKLTVSDIPEEGLSIAFKGGDLSREGLEDFEFTSLPHGEVRVERFRQNVFVKGTLNASLQFDCSRCLVSFPFDVSLSFRHALKPRDDRVLSLKEVELQAEDLEYGYYEENTLELDRVINEHVVLSIPMQPICREDCRGLCPRCGENRNEKACGCPQSGKGSPFDVLKNFTPQTT